MVELATVKEWARYNDWADAKLLESAAPLADEALDREFPIGLGSLRRTLLHIYNGEYLWLCRWKGLIETAWPAEVERVSVAALQERFRANWAERNRFMETLRSSDMSRMQNYRDSLGSLFQASLMDMSLQDLTHATHHRAQAVNMLRHLGATLPTRGVDYIFMKLEQVADAPPDLDVATLLHFFDYADKTQRRVHEAAAKLSDGQLDQPFEMGVGTIRKTLLHIRFAEQWWYENWTQGPGNPFPEEPECTSVQELERLFRSTVSARDAFLKSKKDADLQRIVEAEPRPGVRRSFPLGVTVLQICNHGIHHRAQVANMIKRVGGEALELDYMVSIRKPA